MNLKPTPFLILFSVLAVVGVSVAYAVGTVIVEGNMTVTGDTEFDGKLIDANDDAGNAGQVLSSTEIGIDWIDSPLPSNVRYLVYEDTECTSSGGHPVHIDQGWCPNGARSSFAIFDAGVDLNSIIIGQNKNSHSGFPSSGQLNSLDGCSFRVVSVPNFPDGLFLFGCLLPADGTDLRLVIFDPPPP